MAAQSSKASHDQFSCECHETCGWCCDPWPVNKLKSIEIQGESTDGICPDCRKEAKK